MGDLNDGKYDVGMDFGPITITDPQTPIVFNYVITNSGHEKGMSGQLDKALRRMRSEIFKSKSGFEFPEEIPLVSQDILMTLFTNWALADCDGKYLSKINLVF